VSYQYVCKCGDYVKIEYTTPFSRVKCLRCGETLLDPKKNLLSIDFSNQLLKKYTNALNSNVKTKIETFPRFSNGFIYIAISVLAILSFMYYKFFKNSPDWSSVELLALAIPSFILLTPLIIYYYNDQKSRNIQNISNPMAFAIQYCNILIKNKTKYLYSSISPLGLESKETRVVPFKRIEKNNNFYDISNLLGFTEYWKNIIKGDLSFVRTIAIKSKKDIMIVEEYNDKVIFKINLYFSSYHKALILNKVLFSSPLFWFFSNNLANNDEFLTIRKIILKHHNKWYIAEGELQGILDYATFKQKIEKKEN
jgi:hypothetical protein